MPTREVVSYFREQIVIPSLLSFPSSMRSKAAIELLIGTALVESNLILLKQGIKSPIDGLGPALSVYQIEPKTHRDIWDNYLNLKPNMANYVGRRMSDFGLMFDVFYATKIARLIYWRIKEPLPKADDIEGLARYWKTYYNTHLGKGKVEKFVEIYKRLA